MKIKNIFLKVVFWAGLFFAFLVIAYTAVFFNKIYPGVHVAGVDLSGQTTESAQVRLSNKKAPRVVLASDDPKIQTTLESLNVMYDYQKSAQNAYLVGRVLGFKQRLLAKVNALTQKPNLPLYFSLDEEKLDIVIGSLADQIDVPPTPSTLSINQATVVVNKGRDGAELDQTKLKSLVLENIKYVKEETVAIPVITTKARLEDSEAELIRQRAQNLVGKSIKVTIDYQNFIYSASDLLPLLTADGFKDSQIDKMAANIAQSVNVPPQNARLVFEEGKVKEFAPGRDGLETDAIELTNKIKAAVESLIISADKQAVVEIPVVRTKPLIATGDVNNLGIKELVGRGTSRFAGSIPGRVHNVALAASRMNGLLIKPGDTFSFNGALGDVSAYTGYQQAYVIKDGKTILGDGGGVCQVSTTLFRAALNAGIPIVERKAHAYRVHYYEEDSKPGVDATVYDPTADLKIKNDTPANILIQTKTDKKNLSLVIELYGTADGRVSQILNHRIWDVEPAPPPIYQDDPTLAPGATKQIDFSAPGTKAAFDYKVTRGSEVLQNRTFYSNYRPWQAVYLRSPEPQQP